MSVHEYIISAWEKLLKRDEVQVRPVVRCPSVPPLTTFGPDSVTPDASTERPFFVVSESSQPRKQRRPGPAHPRYGIPPKMWPDVLRRVEQGDTLRQIAQDYGVSYETVRRTTKAAHKQQGGEA